MKVLRVLVACEESQVVTKAFRARGHEAYSCDILPCSGGHPEWHHQCDVMEVLYGDWDILIAHPPCTRLANSGVRWLRNPPKNKTLVQMWKEFFNGADFYRKIRDARISKKAIENPIMHSHAKEVIGVINRQIVQPWWFGDKAFKATGFELIGLPELKPTNRLDIPEKGTDEYKKWSYTHRMSPSKNRAMLRSKSFPGISNAMAEQWG